ncbi:MAG: hypothetical protein Q9217_004237 [Psora testacea]
MHSRGRRILSCFVLITASLLLLLGLYNGSGSAFSAPIASPPAKTEDALYSGYDGAPCPSHAPWLQSELKVNFPVQYARRDIVVRPQLEMKRASVTHIDGALFPDFEVIDPHKDLTLNLSKCLGPLVLDVPAWPTEYPNASHLVFGLSTSLSRLEDSLPYFQRWLAYTNARLIAIVTAPEDDFPDKKDMIDVETRMRDVGIAATLVRPFKKETPFELRYFSLIKVLHSHCNPLTQWAVMIDDDTFFPSMASLISTLARFDPTEQYYLGALSEEWWTVGIYSLMAFGGAGIFLSLPLLELLDAHYKDCIKESLAATGDLRVLECVNWYTDARLTHINGLFQIDLHGDRSGLFESGRKILSLHHWKGGWWDEGNLGNIRIGHETWFPMDVMHLVADICDTCFLQRWQFENDVVLANGYSISSYPRNALMNFKKHQGLEKVELTWLTPAHIKGSRNKGFDHYIGPTRPPLKLEEDKLQYRFLDAVAVDGGVRQYYHHFGLNGDLDTVVELFWIREEVYNKAKST